MNNGATIFQDYCGACHKKDAVALKTEKKNLKEARFIPLH